MDKLLRSVIKYIGNRLITLNETEFEIFNIHTLKHVCHNVKLAKVKKKWTKPNSVVNIYSNRGKKTNAKDGMLKNSFNVSMP